MPTAPPIAAGVCALQIQPGPDDAAPTEGDLTDWSHIFGGRARLCLAGIAPAEFEGPAWCTWSERFTSVRDAGLLPLPVDADTGRIDAGIWLEPARAYLSGTSPAGDISSWEGVVPPEDLRVHDQGRWGIARFVVQPFIDPEHPPAVRPQDVAGLLRWSCLEPTIP